MFNCLRQLEITRSFHKKDLFQDLYEGGGVHQDPDPEPQHHARQDLEVSGSMLVRFADPV